jgi:AraC-like DNA-binding protein/mannose-6-phosphate isomerase-like protein (cupin superfamily)
MKSTNSSSLDIIVTSINHVVERLPNSEWKLTHYKCPKHYIIGFALEGSAVYTINNVNYNIKKGDVVFFTGEQERSATNPSSNPWHFITISFDLNFGDADAQRFLHSLPNVFPNVPSKIMKHSQELNHVWTGKRLGFLLKSRSILQDILYQLVKYQDVLIYNPNHYKKIDMIQQFIQTNYYRNFTVSELAHMANFSESHFRKLFRNVTGMTSIQYANMVKINKAKDIISSGEANVSEAAIQTGFKDIFYFSRLFKTVTGEPPSHFLNN